MYIAYYVLYGFGFLLLFLWSPNQGISIKQAGLKFEHSRIFYVELFARLSILLNVIVICIILYHYQYINTFSMITQLIAFILFYISKRTMGKAWSTNIDDSQNEMIQVGVYRLSRNPVYVAYHLALVSFCFYDWRFVFIYSAFAIAFHMLVLEEEKWMNQKFGENFNAYKKKVRRYF